MSDGNFYVSTNGDDGEGLGTAGSPWATIQNAIDTINSGDGLQDGDTIWVAPGTYYSTFVDIEVDAGSAPNSTAGAFIRGDYSLSQSWGTSENPGQIKLTGSTSGSLIAATGGPIIDWAAHDYVEVWDVALDGTNESVYLADGDAGNSGQVIKRCTLMGRYGARYLAVDECVAICSQYGFNDCRALRNGYVRNSVSICGNYAGYYTEFENCIIACGGIITRYSRLKNTHVISGNSLWYDSEAGCDNCLISGCLTLYSSGTVPAGVFYLANEDNGNAEDESNNRCIYYVTDGAGTSPAEGHILTLPPATEIIRHLAQAFAPVEWNDFDFTDGPSASAFVSIEDCTRTAYGKKHIGPYSISKFTSEDDATNGPTVKLEREGEIPFYINVPASSGMAISVVTATDLDGGSDYPQIEFAPVDGSAFTLVSDTATSTSETLTVTVSAGQPLYDCVGRFKLITKNSSADSFTEFHTLSIS